jgi:threonine 3-dehydrogenase
VLVSGAGPIGVMAAAVAKHVGARNVVITDVNEYRWSWRAKWASPGGERREREP